MRYFIIFLLTLAKGLVAVAQTSIYHHFPETDANWYCAQGVNANPCFENCEFSYSATGEDTIIEGILYKKLFYTVEMVSGPGICYCNPLSIGQPPAYSGAIRQDTIERKVYFRQLGTGEEILLYDFSLNIGDTVSGYFEDCGPIIITDVDSVLVGTAYRKRWNSEPYFGQIIEGIGSTYGFFSMCSFEDTPILLCFNQENENLYSYSEFDQCEPVHIDRIRFDNFSISPNPVIDISTVKLDGKYLLIEIFNRMGEKVSAIDATNKLNIDLIRDDYPQGMYHLRAVTKEGACHTGRFIVN